MIQGGLASITFRELSPAETVACAVRAGLEAIEWGGDIHVPHGDIAKAREARILTEDAGLRVASYGSYYRAGCESKDRKRPTFLEVLDTAVALRAPAIRVWAGNRGSNDADGTWRETVVAETRRIADLAAQAEIAIAFEFHGGTLTDTTESTCRLLETLDHHNVRTYWQTPLDLEEPARFQSLEHIIPWLGNLHVFHWRGFTREPLAQGADAWRRYLARAATTGRCRFALLEFVEDDSPEYLLRDAQTLKELLNDVQSEPH